MRVKNKKPTITRTLANTGSCKDKKHAKPSTYSKGLRDRKTGRFIRKREGDHLGGAGKKKE